MNKNLATLGAVIIMGASLLVADATTAPFEDKGSKYELPIEVEVKQGEKIEIAKEVAEITLKGWNEEYALKFSPYIPNSEVKFQSEGEVNGLRDKIEYTFGDTKTFIKSTENGAEIGITLGSRPAVSHFCYAVEGAGDFEFIKQYPLWQQYGLKEPTASCTDTECDTDNNGEMDIFRPENVVNSFAVYSLSKANHVEGQTNYQTGKILHRYRAQAKDNNGDTLWGDSIYEEGMICDYFDPDWLDKAEYPVEI